MSWPKRPEQRWRSHDHSAPASWWHSSAGTRIPRARTHADTDGDDDGGDGDGGADDGGNRRRASARPLRRRRAPRPSRESSSFHAISPITRNPEGHFGVVATHWSSTCSPSRELITSVIALKREALLLDRIMRGLTRIILDWHHPVCQTLHSALTLPLVLAGWSRP